MEAGCSTYLPDGRRHELEYRDVGGSDDAYWQLLSDLWAEQQDTIIVEHDIVVRPDTLDELANCPSPWCACRYEYAGMGVWWGMGCVKFTGGLMTRTPDAVHRAGVMWDERHAKKHWCRQDAWLQGTILPQLGEVQCRHETTVEHLGVGVSHGCY